MHTQTHETKDSSCSSSGAPPKELVSSTGPATTDGETSAMQAVSSKGTEMSQTKVDSHVGTHPGSGPVTSSAPVATGTTTSAVHSSNPESKTSNVPVYTLNSGGIPMVYAGGRSGSGSGTSNARQDDPMCLSNSPSSSSFSKRRHHGFMNNLVTNANSGLTNGLSMMGQQQQQQQQGNGNGSMKSPSFLATFHPPLMTPGGSFSTGSPLQTLSEDTETSYFDEGYKQVQQLQQQQQQQQHQHQSNNLLSVYAGVDMERGGSASSVSSAGSVSSLKSPLTPGNTDQNESNPNAMAITNMLKMFNDDSGASVSFEDQSPLMNRLNASARRMSNPRYVVNNGGHFGASQFQQLAQVDSAYSSGSGSPTCVTSGGKSSPTIANGLSSSSIKYLNAKRRERKQSFFSAQQEHNPVDLNVIYSQPDNEEEEKQMVNQMIANNNVLYKQENSANQTGIERTSCPNKVDIEGQQQQQIQVDGPHNVMSLHPGAVGSYIAAGYALTTLRGKSRAGGDLGLFGTRHHQIPLGVTSSNNGMNLNSATTNISTADLLENQRIVGRSRAASMGGNTGLLTNSMLNSISLATSGRSISNKGPSLQAPTAAYAGKETAADPATKM